MTAKAISVTIISDRNSGQLQMERISELNVNRISHLTLAPLLKRGELVDTILASKPDLVIWCGTALSATYLTRLRSIRKPLIWDIDSDIYSLKIFSRISFRELFHPHHNLLWPQMLIALCPRFIIRSVANSSSVSRIIVPSQYLKDSLSKIGVDVGKITVIPSTIDMDDMDLPSVFVEREEFREKLGFRPDEFILTYLGSPCTLRGVDTVILSMQKIVSKSSNIRLVILSRRELGKSSSIERFSEMEEKYLNNLVRKMGVGDRVEIISGRLDKSRLRQYIEASDVIALPFKLVFSEPPLSVLEAMSLGKVVVTTNLKSLCEIMQNDRGILIEPGRPDALAHVVLFLAEHPKKALYFGENAKRFATSLPDWDHIAHEFVKVLNETFEKVHGVVC